MQIYFGFLNLYSTWQGLTTPGYTKLNKKAHIVRMFPQINLFSPYTYIYKTNNSWMNEIPIREITVHGYPYLDYHGVIAIKIQKHIIVTSQWARCGLTSPASRLFTLPFIQVQIKEDIKAPHHWPLCGWIPAQMASNAENDSIWWSHHDLLYWVDKHLLKMMPTMIPAFSVAKLAMTLANVVHCRDLW